MEAVIFIITALTALVSALLVVTGRDPVRSVLFLVLTFFCVAVLYIMLGAQFVAAMQVIVYAGAIMVLFLFVVMLLNIRTEESWEASKLTRNGIGFMVAGGILLVVVSALKGTFSANAPLNPDMGTVAAVGDALFTRFMLPFEIVSILLLAAIFGVVMMLKRKEVEPESTGGAES